MKLRAVFGVALLTLLISSASARPVLQAKPHRARKSSDVASIRHFVQSFYDWYTPRVMDLDRKEDLGLETLRQKGWMFTPRLRRALWKDWETQQMDKGVITGLDADPYLNSQDPDDRYKVGRIHRDGDRWVVSIEGLADKYNSNAQTVVAIVANGKAGWVITNFIEGSRPDDDLLSMLEQPEPYLASDAGDSPLLAALKNGQKDHALALIKKGANVNAADKNGNAPLHVAAFSCYADVVGALLLSGANIDAKNNFGETPLFVAMYNCRDTFLEKMSEKIDPQIALDSARRDPLKVVTLLVEHGADVNLPAKGEYDSDATPLIAACKHGDELPVVELLVKNGAKVNAKDALGDTALNWAAWNVHPNDVQFLLRHGAQVNVQNQPGDETALNLAERSTDDAKDPRPAQIIKMLKAAGAVHGKSK